MQTRDQEYAQAAFKQVKAIKDTSSANSYGSMAHKLPILIHTSGLAQALAFVHSRGKEGGPQQLLADLSQTVLRDDTAQELLKQSRESNLREYIRLTELTLAALLWYKRYAQSILGVSPETEGENQE